MNFLFLSSINYVAVAASSFLFFLLGSLWFSGLFGSLWVQELKRHKIIIKNPTKHELTMKMLLTFAANCVASFAMACLVIMTGSNTLESGLLLGIITACGFAATAIGSVFIWESKSLKLFLIDAGYPAIGIIAVAMLLSIWR